LNFVALNGAVANGYLGRANSYLPPDQNSPSREIHQKKKQARKDCKAQERPTQVKKYSNI
jgi:hypothetical protein